MKMTIDASVFVAAARNIEPHYAVSKAFLLALQTVNAEIFCPTLVLPESSAAIARRSGDAALALLTISLIASHSGLQLIPITEARAQRAAHIAAYQRLHGADSIYVAIAEELGATLITWDNDMLQRSPAVVTTITPADWLNAQPINPNQPS